MHTSFSRIAFAAADLSSGAAPVVTTPALGATAAATVAKSNIAAPVTVKPAKPSKPAAAKPGKPAKPVAAATATEAKPDPRLARAERVSADRSVVSALYATFEANRVSVPVKALSAFKPLATTAHPIARNPSVRQAAAIVAAFVASGIKLTDGASAPRVFEINGVRSCIENGVLRDAVSSGLVRVSGNTPETEKLTIPAKQAAALAGLVGERAFKLAANGGKRAA